MRTAKLLLAIALVVIIAASACNTITEGPLNDDDSKKVEEIYGENPETAPEPPELYGEELPEEVATIVYIIDISCSMDSGWSSWTDINGSQVSGYRLDRAKSEVITKIKNHDEEFWFDVVSFNCNSTALFGELKEATSDNKNQAVAWIEDLSAHCKAGTGPAVAWALQNPGYEEAMHYILLTGGVPTCIDDIDAHWQTHMAIIREANNKGATIHTILVHPDFVELYDFGQAVAEETGGSLTVVE